MSDTLQESIHSFVGFLLRGASPENPNSRGFLAKLRRSLGRSTPDAQTLSILAEHLPDDPWQRRCFELTATLFALHPESKWGGNLGSTLREVGDHESAQKRFVALLNSDADDLPYRLRQAISLANSKNVRVDWAQLIKDLIRWRMVDRPVQYEWARAYWRRPLEDSLKQNPPA